MTMHEDDRSREGRVLATELTRRGLVKSAAAATAGAAVFGGAAKFGARSAAAAAPSAAQAAAGEQLFYNYVLQNNPLTYDFNSNLYAGAEPEVWAGLLTFDPDGRVVPDWAERWESNEDASVWTFYLRQNNKGWSNGDPVTAHDAVWSLARILNPETNNSYAFILYDVKNGEAFNGGTAKVEDLGLKAIDDWTVEITLEGPRANFPQKIAYTACVFAHRPSVEKYGEKWALGGDIPLVSNGPYKLDLWEQGVKADHSLNPGYWDAETIRVTKLIDPIIPGDQTALAFESGKGDQQLDWTPVGAADLQRFQGDPNLAPLLKQFVYPGIWMLLPSNGQAPFDKIEVRRALSHAIDRDRLVTVTNGLALPANVMTPVGVYGYFEDPAISEIQKFDPALAMEALKGTEYEGGQNWPEITVLMRSDEGQLNSNLMMNDIAAQLKENLGMDVKINELPEATFRPTLYENTAQLVWIRWWMDYPDADNQYYDMFYGKKASNKRQAWTNDQFDQLVVQAKGELDPEKRLELYKQAEKIIQEDVGYIPVVFRVDQNAFKPWVKELPTNQQGFTVPDGNIYVRGVTRVTTAERPAE